jgi:serine/threonine protein kinase/tetratricopeptide (TPR) repeat protein
VLTGVLTPVPGDDAETVFSAPEEQPAAEPAPVAPDTTGLPASARGVRHVPKSKTALGPLTVGQQFGLRYTILKQLGIGGMGAVYQAWDAELSVAVALKVIRPEAAQDPGAAQDIERRFKQELLLARQVTHKNVVRIHDLGEISGIKYITMPYIEGSDLATVLRDSPKLPIPKVMAIARQIAAGLEAAHEAGVVHRDLKPANVMIEKDEHAIIMDFGIARSTSRVGSTPSAPTSSTGTVTADDTLTQAAATIVGAVIGTIEYMAPEQARGEHVDQRADVYAFGLILYDMLTGRRRVERAPSAVYELQQRMAQPPASVRAAVPEVPEALDKLVTKCIEPEADKRYQTTSELVAALNRLDDNGKLKRIKKVVGLPLTAALVIALLALSAGIWLYTRPPVEHAPISVVIADIDNRTRDAAFDGTLEPMLKRVLDDAGFITSYEKNGIRALGLQPVERLDAAAAKEVAVKQGWNVLLAGSIELERSDGLFGIGGGTDSYRVSFDATHPVTEEVLATARARASSKDEVLPVATRLMTRIRSALGDETSESTQQFNMASLSTTSLEVVRLYAAAMEAQSRNRFKEAQENAAKAVALDPNFGIGHLVMAVSARNQGRLAESQEYLSQAVSHIEGMTQRERYSTRGYSSFATGDYEQCVKEYSDLIARNPGDVGGHNQLALCYSYLRQMDRAVQEMQTVVDILPNQPLFRDNLALYANYDGDFPRAEREARAVEGPDAYAGLALAFAQLGQGQVSQAIATYEKLAQIEGLGPSFSASGLGDVAAFEGRYSEAVQILRRGADMEIASKPPNPDAAAAKLVAAAYAELSRGRNGAAIEFAAEALEHSAAVKIRFLAARIFIEARAADRATPLREGLAKELFAEPRAYAKLLEGMIALQNGNAPGAMDLVREGNKLFDTWIGQFELGRVLLEADAFSSADSAFDACLGTRRGEALSLFVDEEPTYAYLPQVHYYQGRAREGMKSAEAAKESYNAYLAIRGKSTEDALLREVRKLVKP